VVKQPTGYREILGSYPGLKLMILSGKSFVLANTCTVDDYSCFQCAASWIIKMIDHSFKHLSLTYYQTHPQDSLVAY
jgi:hypothetical protein